MNKDKSFESSKSGRGRHRGKAKSPKDIEFENKAKGHPQESEENSSTPQNNIESSSSPKLRGNQKGFGKNQGKEAGDRSAPHGTRAEGAEHG